uniref:Uncharacterized protein n=1 Tax=Rhizophora mucronata TaxID=61149 RepID=A0A2P2QC21_RHIMU
MNSIGHSYCTMETVLLLNVYPALLLLEILSIILIDPP